MAEENMTEENMTEENMTEALVPIEQEQEQVFTQLKEEAKEVTQDTSKTLSERAKDYVGVVATMDAVSDQTLRAEVSTLKQEELKLRAEADVKSERVNSKRTDKELQEAEFGTYSGSAAYAGIRKPLPSKMQKFLFPILCVIQSIFLLVFGTVTSVITIVGDCVNAVIERISTFTKIARATIVTLLIIGAIYLVYLILQQVLAGYGILI